MVEQEAVKRQPCEAIYKENGVNCGKPSIKNHGNPQPSPLKRKGSETR